MRPPPGATTAASGVPALVTALPEPLGSPAGWRPAAGKVTLLRPGSLHGEAVCGYAVRGHLRGWRDLKTQPGLLWVTGALGTYPGPADEHEDEAGSFGGPLRIFSLKRKTIPKIAVLATGLAIAMMAATIHPAPTAQASPSYASACDECHTAGGSVTAIPSSATPAPGAAYTVALAFTGGTSPSGFWISGNGVSVTGSSATSASMSAPAVAGTYTYTVWVRAGVVNSTTYSITVAAAPPTVEPTVEPTVPPAVDPSTSIASISSLSPNHGIVGSTVTIVGAGFGTDGNVQFGTADATASSWAASEMVVTVPAMDNNFLPMTTSATTRPVWYQHGRTFMVTVTPKGGTASIGVGFRIDSARDRGHGHGHHDHGVRHEGDDS